MEGGYYGYSRESFDRFVQRQDASVVNRFQQKYWKTKQTLIKVTGKQEDEHVVASDADLDAKLEVFHSIQRTCMELLKVMEQYQTRICCLSQEESELGRFLRSQGSQDQTRAGRIMQATGKALCFSSQQRLSLRKPLCRLYQEVETFRYRAISDTWLTVNRMEQSRTEYRGALLWMKDVSQELDPDTHKQMDKFRKVQTQVRTTKASFDKLKNDVCQKVDLLGASRCNLLSHVLTTYQTTLLHFWEKTSHTMAAIHESFKGIPPYDFSTLKSLEAPVNKLSKRVKKRVRAQTPKGEGSRCVEHQHTSIDCEKPTEDSNEAWEGLWSAPPDQEGGEQDSVALLSQVLGSTALDLGDFWREVFEEGDVEGPSGAPNRGGPAEPLSSIFLPSHLLDQNINNLQSPISDWAMSIPQSVSQATEQSSGANQSSSSMAVVRESSAAPEDRSTWFHLFADLDPLSNPDAVGKCDKDQELHKA